MRIVVHGQQAFGKAVLEALLKRGENVVAVYVAPEKPGQKADPLKEAAVAAKLPIYQPASYKDPSVGTAWLIALDASSGMGSHYSDAREVANNEPGHERTPRFDVFRIDADVADVRIRQRDDLTGVRRVGQDLLITGHRRVEDDFADRVAHRANRPAMENGAIGQREDRGCRRRKERNAGRGGGGRSRHGGTAGNSDRTLSGRFAGARTCEAGTAASSATVPAFRF